MTDGDTSVPTSAEVVIGLARPDDVERIDCAIQLGNQARDTLGYLPFAHERGHRLGAAIV